MSTFLDTFVADLETETREVVAEMEAIDKADKERPPMLLPDAPERTNSAYQPWLGMVKGVAARMVAGDRGPKQ